MATTKITSNVLALSAAQTNINNDGSFTLSVPTLINNTVSVSGNLTVDTNTLFVDSTNNRVGIGTTSPTEKLTVSGNISASGNIQTSNGIVMTGAPTSVNDINYIQGTNSNTTVGFLAGVGTFNANSGPYFAARGNTYTALTGQRGAMFFSAGNVSSPTGLEGVITFSTGSNNVRMIINRDGNVGVGTTTPSEKLTVTGNISASGNVTASNLVYTTSDQTIAGAKTFSDNIVGNGTANRLPNQLAVASSDIITKGLADSRYTSRNERITDDTTFVQTTWEQFLDFDDQYNQDLTIAAAFGAGTAGASPGVFGDVWTTSNAGVTAFSGNDAHTHRGIFLVRGPTASNQAFYIGINRTTIPYNLTNRVDEFTCRVFVGSTDFRTQGYFKIGPIPKGGTGASDTTLRAGLIFNPYFHATNLVLGAYKSTTISPFTFTTNPLSADFLDTGVNFIDLMDKWVNITYKIDRSVGPTVTVIITRENAVLFQASYNVATHPVVSTWARRSELYTTGASNEIGIQSGKFTYTTRSQIHIDYLHYKVTGTSAAPSNWNSLRF